MKGNKIDDSLICSVVQDPSAVVCLAVDPLLPALIDSD